MSSLFGLSPSGFIAPRQQDIIAALQQAFQSQFGNTVNLSPSTVFGQLINIFSEREALLWEALQDDVISQSLGGAQGVYVDNLLSFVGLTRLPAAATVTNPTPATQSDGRIINGFELYGTPGTVVPAGAIVQTSATPPLSFTLDAQVTIGQAQNDIQDIYLSQAPQSGTYALSLECPSGTSVTTPAIAYNALPAQALLTFGQTPSTGTFTLTMGGQTTAAIAYGAQPMDVQAALRALSNGGSATVVGSTVNGYAISSGTSACPTITVSDATNGKLTIVPAIGAAIEGIEDPVTSTYPFTDVVVSTPSATQIRLTFGGGAPATGQNASGSQSQGTIQIASNALLAGNTLVSASVAHTVLGAVAKGVGTATCTVTGANAVSAGTLNVIGSSQAGLTGCNNPLDCLTGRAVESDAQAVNRITTLTGSIGSGPLQASLGQLSQVSGVTQAIAFQNTSNSALQRLNFINTPTSGTFELSLEGGQTAALPYNVTANALQQALAAISGFGSLIATGDYINGFVLDMTSCYGGQALPLTEIVADNTGGTLTASFGRPPHSVEFVVQGGTDAAVAQTLLGNAPGGIALYGAPVLTTVGNGASGQSTLTLGSTANVTVGLGITGQGIPVGATVTSINGQTVTLGVPLLANLANTPVAIGHVVTLKDAGGNPVNIAFTRPVEVPIYVALSIVSDMYLTPGNPQSGINPSSQFQPATCQAIAQDVINSINAIGIGGLITSYGTLGAGSSFRTVPGIVNVSLAFDTVPSPTNTQPLRLLPEQSPLAALSFTEISYT